MPGRFYSTLIWIVFLLWCANGKAQDLQAQEIVLPLQGDKRLVNILFSPDEDYVVAEWVMSDKNITTRGLAAITYPSLQIVSEVLIENNVKEWFFLPSGKLWVSYAEKVPGKHTRYSDIFQPEVRNFPGIDTVKRFGKGIKIDFRGESGIIYAPQLNSNGYFLESAIGLSHNGVLDTGTVYRTDEPVYDVALAPDEKVAAILFADSTFEIRSVDGNKLLHRGRAGIKASDLHFSNNSRFLYLLNREDFNSETTAEVFDLNKGEQLPAIELGGYDIIQPSTGNNLLAVVKNFGKTLLLLQTDSATVLEEAELLLDGGYRWSSTSHSSFQLLEKNNAIAFLSGNNNKAIQLYDFSQWLNKKKDYNKLEFTNTDWGFQLPQPVLNYIGSNVDRHVVYSESKVFIAAGNTLVWYNPLLGKVIRKVDIPDAKNWVFDPQGNKGIYLKYYSGGYALFEADMQKGTYSVRPVDVAFGYNTPTVLYWPEQKAFFIYGARQGYLYHPELKQPFKPLYFTEMFEALLPTGSNTLLGKVGYYSSAYKQFENNNLQLAIVGDSLTIQQVWPNKGFMLRVNDRVFVEEQRKLKVFDLALNKVSDCEAYNALAAQNPQLKIDPTGRFLFAGYYTTTTHHHIYSIDNNTEIFHQEVSGYGKNHLLLSKSKLLQYGYEGYQMFDTECRCTTSGAGQSSRYDKEILQATPAHINTGYGVFNLGNLSREAYPDGKISRYKNDGVLLEDDTTFVATEWVKVSEGKEYAAVQLYHFGNHKKLRHFPLFNDADDAGITVKQIMVEGRELLIWFNKLIKGKGKDSWQTKSQVPYLKRLNIDNGNEWTIALKSETYNHLLRCGNFVVLTDKSRKKNDYSQACDVYDRATGQFLKTFHHTSQNYYVAPVPLGNTGKFFHANDYANEVCIIDVNTGSRFGKNFIKMPSAVTCMAAAKNNELLLCGLNNGMVYVYNSNNIDAPLAVLKQNNSPIARLTYSNDKVWAYTYDRQIKCWQVSTGRLLFTLHLFLQKNTLPEYVFVSPDNYYLSSKNVQPYIHFTYGSAVFSLQQFDLQYNRPDKLLQLVNAGNTALIDLYYKAWQKRLVNAGADSLATLKLSSAPTAAILQREKISTATTSSEVVLQVLFADSFLPLKTVNVLVNGVPLYGIAGKSVLAQNARQFTETFTIPLSRWNNHIEIVCTNTKGVASASAEINISYAPADKSADSSNMYLIAVGVTEYEQTGWNLKYAAKDASDLALALKQKYPSLKYKLLTDEMVNEQNLKMLKKFLQGTKPDDRVIFSYSGHGLADLNTGEYYLSSYQMDFKNPSAQGINYNVVEWLLDSIPARNKLILIDACQSGAIDKELLAGKTQTDTAMLGENVVAYGKGASITNANAAPGSSGSFELMQQIFAQQTSATGATVIAASSGTSPAYENNKTGEGNGVFTYALMKALTENLGRGTESYISEKTISISELAGYLCPKVALLTNGTQTPEVRNFNPNANWRVW